MKNEIIQGDCLEEMKSLEDNSVDLIVTDPPYGIDYQSNFSKKFDKLENDDSLDFFEEFVKESKRVLKDDTGFYCFTRFDVYPEMYSIIDKYFEVKNHLVLPTTHVSMGDLKASYSQNYESVIFALNGRREFNKVDIIRDEFNYRYDSRNESNGFKQRLPALMDFVNATEFNLDLEHPTQKAIEPIEIFIRLHSNKGDLVLDPFCGCGSTCVAAKKNNRDYLGIEIEDKYVSLSKQRLSEINSKSDWDKFVKQKSL